MSRKTRKHRIIRHNLRSIDPHSDMRQMVQFQVYDIHNMCDDNIGNSEALGPLLVNTDHLDMLHGYLTVADHIIQRSLVDDLIYGMERKTGEL